MESRDILVLVAEVAVALAGFSSVFVAVENRSVRTWPAVQRFNLRILLQVSALAVFFAFFPLILERVVAEPQLWRWALGGYGVAHLVDVSSFILRRPPEATAVHRITSYTGLSVALASIAIACLGTPRAAEVTYLCVLVMHLGVAGMGFAFLVFGNPVEAAE